MKRQDFMAELLDYEASHAERPHIERFLSLMREKENCYYRDCFDPGHMTGSALLISQDGSKVLLNHHKIFNRWMTFGGHADGEEDIRHVALREAFEESGIDGISLVDQQVFDIDIHPVGENPRKGEPSHFHFDSVFLLRAPHENYVVSSESNDLKWCGFDEAMELCQQDQSQRMLRLLEKWKVR